MTGGKIASAIARTWQTSASSGERSRVDLSRKWASPGRPTVSTRTRDRKLAAASAGKHIGVDDDVTSHLPAGASFESRSSNEVSRICLRST